MAAQIWLARLKNFERDQGQVVREFFLRVRAEQLLIQPALHGGNHVRGFGDRKQCVKFIHIAGRTFVW